LLAVESLGLGAVWTAVYPYEDRMKPVIEELKLPENIIPLNVIPIGYSTGEDKPKDKWKPENLHWNQW
jgi:nitroreductase